MYTLILNFNLTTYMTNIEDLLLILDYK